MTLKGAGNKLKPRRLLRVLLWITLDINHEGVFRITLVVFLHPRPDK